MTAIPAKWTRWHPETKFRQAWCPACDQWAYTMSLQDDTRWRYMEHKAGETACVNSRELVPKEKP